MDGLQMLPPTPYIRLCQWLRKCMSNNLLITMWCEQRPRRGRVMTVAGYIILTYCYV